MNGFWAALRGRKPSPDPMRASAALTTVYLLEQNQKFEQFMRQQVEALEARVAAQQARLSDPAEAEVDERWPPLAPPAEAEAVETPPLARLAVEDFELRPARQGWAGGSEAEVSATPVEPEAGGEAIPDYLALMSGPTVKTDPNEILSAEETIAGVDEGEPLSDSPDEGGDEMDLAEATPVTLPEQVTDIEATAAIPEFWSDEYETFPLPIPAIAETGAAGPDPAVEGAAPVEPGSTQTSQTPATLTGAGALEVAPTDDPPLELEGADPLEADDDAWEAALPDGQKRAWT